MPQEVHSKDATLLHRAAKVHPTLIVTVSDQKKRSQLSSDEFLTLESTICLEQDIVGLQNANLNSEAIEFSNFFKQAKDMAADKVYELKLSVVSNPLKETTSVKVNTSTIYVMYVYMLHLTNVLHCIFSLLMVVMW